MTILEEITINMTTPLPCAIYDADKGECGNDAFIAFAYRIVPATELAIPGYKWGLLPICKTCVERMQGLYPAEE